MTKGRTLFLLLGALLAIGLLIWKSGQKSPAPSIESPAKQASASPRPASSPINPGRPAMEWPQPEDLQPIPPHPDAEFFGQGPPEQEPAQLLAFFEIYRRAFGAFPSGEDNAQLMRALCGANPEKLPIFPLTHARLDRNRGLLDAWGHPFVFHLISSQHLEIRSLGPDGVIFTADDVVASKPQNP